MFDSKTSTGLRVNYNDWNPAKESVKLKATAKDKDFINSKLMNLRKFVIEDYNMEYNNGLPIQK